MKKSIIVNTLFAFIKFFINIMLIKLADALLPTASFGLLLYIRRIAPIIGNIGQLGFSQAAMINIPRNSKEDEVFWPRAALLLITLLFVFSSIILALSDNLKTSALVLTSFALCIDYIVRSFFIARFKFLTSNILELMSVGIFAFGLLCFSINDVFLLIYINYGLSILILALYFYIFIYYPTKYRGFKFEFNKTGTFLINAVKFGAPRSLSGVLELAVTAIPIFVLGEYGSINLNIAVNFFRLPLVVVAPLAEVVLVTINRKVSAESKSSLQLNILIYIKFLIPLSLLVAMITYLLAHTILNIWIPNKINPTIMSLSSALCLAIPGMILYGILKGYVDSKFSRPYTLYLMLIANVLSIVTSLVYYDEIVILSYALSGIYILIGLYMIYISSTQYATLLMLFTSYIIAFLISILTRSTLLSAAIIMICCVNLIIIYLHYARNQYEKQ